VEQEDELITLVSEYRTRLISDVVTGKLDVRGVELPAVEEYVDAGIEDALDGDRSDLIEAFDEE
jgi:type I restriction enzyme S subunit